MKQLLSDSIEDYRAFRVSQSMSRSTLTGDRTTLTTLLTSVGNIWLHKLDEAHLTNHLSMRSQQLSAASLNLEMVRLKSFFDWAARTKRAPRDFDPLAGRRKAPVRKRERERVPSSRFPELLDNAGRRCARDRAFIAVGLFTLLRDKEMSALRVRDLNLAGGTLYAVMTKNHKEDMIPLAPILEAELRRWLLAYQEACGPLDQNWYLLPRRTPHTAQEGGRYVASDEEGYIPTAPVAVGSVVVKPILESVGIKTRDENGNSLMEGAHTLRRSGARAYYDQFVAEGRADALRIVQTMLNHSSQNETEKYIGLTADRLTRDQLVKQVRFAFESVPNVRDFNGDQGRAAQSV